MRAFPDCRAGLRNFNLPLEFKRLTIIIPNCSKTNHLLEPKFGPEDILWLKTIHDDYWSEYYFQIKNYKHSFTHLLSWVWKKMKSTPVLPMDYEYHMMALRENQLNLIVNQSSAAKLSRSMKLDSASGLEPKCLKRIWFYTIERILFDSKAMRIRFEWNRKLKIRVKWLLISNPSRF